MRVPNSFSGTRVFRYLKLGSRDLKAKSGRVSVLKVCARGGMPNITLGITGLKNPIGDKGTLTLQGHFVYRHKIMTSAQN